MDYSLLVGIHEKEQAPAENYSIAEEFNISTIETPTQVFYVGIVDILTDYGCAKRAETFLSGTSRWWHPKAP